jgi:hypothetical protein
LVLEIAKDGEFGLAELQEVDMTGVTIPLIFVKHGIIQRIVDAIGGDRSLEHDTTSVSLSFQIEVPETQRVQIDTFTSVMSMGTYTFYKALKQLTAQFGDKLVFKPHFVTVKPYSGQNQLKDCELDDFCEPRMSDYPNLQGKTIVDQGVMFRCVHEHSGVASWETYLATFNKTCRGNTAQEEFDKCVQNLWQLMKSSGTVSEKLQRCLEDARNEVTSTLHIEQALWDYSGLRKYPGVLVNGWPFPTPNIKTLANTICYHLQHGQDEFGCPKREKQDITTKVDEQVETSIGLGSILLWISLVVALAIIAYGVVRHLRRSKVEKDRLQLP